MPTLILSDGKRVRVGYGKASAINAVLTGDKEPETPEQAEYVANVANIDWSDLKQPGGSSQGRATTPAEKSERMKRIEEINKTPGLTGIQKFQQVRALFGTKAEESVDDNQIP